MASAVGLLFAASLPVLLLASSQSQLSAYQVLLAYDFPVGLLPQGVSSYQIDPSTGKFTVHLNSSCSFTIDGYDLKYKTTITGTISKDKIKNLSGIQVKILFFWLNIDGVTKDGDNLEFSVGIISASFPIDNFYESPKCGCGFDCVNTNPKGKKPRLISFKRIPDLFQM